MVSKTRGAVHGKKKGKRKASSPPSPSLSESSHNTIGEAFVERSKTTKRIKQEPTDEPPAPSWTASAVEHNESSFIEGSEDFQAVQKPDNSWRIAPGTEKVMGDRSAPDSTFTFEAPTDLLNILSTRDTGTKRFQGRIEEVIVDAFAIIPRSEDEAPGLAYIDYIIEALEKRGTPVERAEEVKQRLMELWRAQVAGYLGRNINSTSELQDAVRSIVGALPFRSDHHGFFLSPRGCGPTPNGTSAPTDVDDHVETKAATVNRSENSLHALPASANSPIRNDRTTTAGASHAIEPPTPRSSSFEYSDAIVKEDVFSHGRFTNGMVPDKDEEANSSKKLKRHSRVQFAEPTDMFRFHLEKVVRYAAEQTLQDVHGGKLFSRRAVAFYSTLDKHEQNAWARLHRQTRNGDLDPLHESAPAKLLADQDIVRRLEGGLISMKSNELSVDVSGDPIFIDFIPRSNADVSRRVMLLVNLPDMPSINVSEARVVRACSTAFGLRPSELQVESWSKHIWVTTFPRSAYADQAKGKAIVLNGRAVVAEHIHSKAPLAFTCDFTDIDASDSEVAYQVAKAFAGREARIKLEVQECRKIYPGRLLLITLPRSQKLIRFYIPINISGSNEIFMACFTPVNPTIPCSFCGDKHRSGRTCEHAQEIRLPSVN